MALTKVKLIADGTIVQSNLHASHGITTADIGEGSNLYYTDARARAAVSVSGNALSYNSSTGVITSNYEESPVFTGNITFGDSHFIGDDADDNLLIQSSANENIIINSVDDLLLRTGGTTKLIVKNSGNVGIGIISPNQALDVNGSINITGGTGRRIYWSNGDMAIHNAGSYAMAFETWTGSALTEKMRIDSSGDVGIGTTSLTSTSGYSTLSISGTTGAQIAFQTSGAGKHYIYSTATDFDIYNGQAGNLKLFTNSTERMRIGSSGHLLLGTDTVAYSGTLLHVGNTSDSQNGIQIQTSTTGYGYILFGDGTGADAYRGQISYKHGDDYMSIHTAGSEKMRIDSSGIIGINKTSGLNAGGFGSPKIVIKQSVNNEWGGINIEAEGNDAIFGIGTSNDAHILAGSYRVTAGYKDIIIKAGGAERLRVDNTQGYIGIRTTSPSTALHIDQPSNNRAGGLYIKLNGNNYGLSAFVNSGGYGVIGSNGNFTTDIITMDLNNGNVGIGANSPSYKLEVNGGTALVGGGFYVSTDQNIQTNSVYTFRDAVYINNPNSSSAATTSNSVMSIGASTGNSVTTSLVTTGAIGVGTTSPAYKLDVNGTTRATSSYHQNVNFTNTPTFQIGTDAFSSGFFVYDSTAAAYRMVVKSSTGNVGVGTTSPETKLDVAGGVKAQTVEYSWHRSNPITSTNSYRHYKTTLYAGAGNNYMHIMGGFTLKAYSYSSNGYGEGSMMFHNWAGTLYSLSVTNRGQWSNFVRSPYVSSDGYVVIVCEHNTYSQPIIDFYQFYTPYGWRSVSVSADTTSNSLTGVY